MQTTGHPPVLHAEDATHPVCLARSIARSINKSHPVSGHAFKELWHTDSSQALMCSVCSHISIGWYRQEGDE